MTLESGRDINKYGENLRRNIFETKIKIRSINFATEYNQIIDRQNL